jgi:hypothetical protein
MMRTFLFKGTRATLFFPNERLTIPFATPIRPLVSLSANISFTLHRFFSRVTFDLLFARSSTFACNGVLTLKHVLDLPCQRLCRLHLCLDCNWCRGTSATRVFVNRALQPLTLLTLAGSRVQVGARHKEHRERACKDGHRQAEHSHHAIEHNIHRRLDSEVRVPVLGRLLQIYQHELSSVFDREQRKLRGRADAKGGAHADAQIALTQRVLGHLKLLFRKRVIPIQQVVAQSPATARPAAQAPGLAETDATHIKISQVLPSTHLCHSSVSAPGRITVNVLLTSLFTSTPFAANGMQEKRTVET